MDKIDNSKVMMIELRGINKTYNNGAPLHVLKGIDLDVAEGEMVSIIEDGRFVLPGTERLNEPFEE